MKNFDEPKPLNDVSQFHDVFDLPVLDTPRVPSIERCRLRLNLLEEELKELKKAIDDKDLVEIADAFCDLQYVLSGAILEFGLGPKFKHLFEEVQRSNMSKVCQTREEAEQTLTHYRTKSVSGYIVEKDNKYLVYRSEDHKVLKSVNYSPADLVAILKENERKLGDAETG
jgi:predicted HAD superfamily Cof-like phosphohydrolase